MEPDLLLAYTYDGSLEGLLSAVFKAYVRKEDPADIVDAATWCPRIGQKEHEVSTDIDRAKRVRAGLVRACGPEAFEAVKAVYLSDEDTKGAATLRFIRHAMKRGRVALHDALHEQTAEFIRINKAVYNERHLWQQFLRFSQVEGGIYVAVCNPSASVVPLLMDWFAGRFNTQAFIIYDEVHGLAGISDGGDWQLVKTDAFHMPPATEDDQVFQTAWKTFYDTIAVEARFNPELRRQFMPKRFWRNIAEMKDGGVVPGVTPRAYSTSSAAPRQSLVPAATPHARWMRGGSEPPRPPR